MNALLDVEGVSKRFRGLRAVDNASFRVSQGAIFALIGPNGAGKTTLVQPDRRRAPARRGPIALRRQRDRRAAARPGLRRGIGRTFQLVRPFPALSVEDNVIVGALLHRHDRRRRARACARGARPARPVRQARPARLRADPAGPQAARSRARARDRAEAAAARRGDGGPAADRDRPHGRDLPQLNRETGLTILLIEHVMRAVMALAHACSCSTTAR